MTYKQFSDKQKQILAECQSLLKKSEFSKFEEKMNFLIKLSDDYLIERKGLNMIACAEEISFERWQALSALKDVYMCNNCIFKLNRSFDKLIAFRDEYENTMFFYEFTDSPFSGVPDEKLSEVDNV